MSITVLLADDHEAVREGLGELLAGESDIAVVGEAADGLAACRKVLELKPDVAVVDIVMPAMNGIDAVRQIVSQPGRTKVLCLSMHNSTRLVLAALESGAGGYLLKDSVSGKLAKAIRTVAAGRPYVDADVAADALKCSLAMSGSVDWPVDDLLTAKEREVLQLIAGGFSTERIAEILGLSGRDVTAHRQSLMLKLDIPTVAGLTRFAIRQGIAPP